MASITIPYAVADFIEMRERGFYYVDKTQYIAKLEDYKAPVFLRPRRFGKSLLVSTLACYYDRTKAHRFEELFGDTWIGTHPTKEHNRYMIIRYDFSAMVMSDQNPDLAIDAEQIVSQTGRRCAQIPLETVARGAGVIMEEAERQIGRAHV